MNENDHLFMELALALAREAFEQDEIPVGALVVSQEGSVIGSGYNITERQFSQSRHAEVCAIEQAGTQQQSWRLERCTLYVTLEPCLMCMGLICLSRIERLVYAASSPLFGYTRDKEDFSSLYTKHIKGVSAGIKAEESKALLEHFFKHKRKGE